MANKDRLPCTTWCPRRGWSTSSRPSILGKTSVLRHRGRAATAITICLTRIDTGPGCRAGRAASSGCGASPRNPATTGRDTPTPTRNAGTRLPFRGAGAKPFLTLPTSCAGPQRFTIAGSARGRTKRPARRRKSSRTTNRTRRSGVRGCSLLSFTPVAVSALPETSAADTPTGLAVNVSFPQEALRVPEGLVEATVKNTTVTLPEGVVINPGQAAGLAACTEEQAKLQDEGAPSCPKASKVGTVKVKTPLLEGALESRTGWERVRARAVERWAGNARTEARTHPPAVVAGHRRRRCAT